MVDNITTAPKSFCFVLMPFEEAFDDVYQLGIKEACVQAGSYCERVDEQIFHESILDRIYNQIAKADIVVADMTGRNANVFYEVGYAHALGKRTILLTRNAQDIPFDLKHFPHIVYGESIKSLRDELFTRIEWCNQNPLESSGQGTIDIELFLEDENLSSGNVVYHVPAGKVPHPNITIQNTSSHFIETGSFRLGVISKQTNCHQSEITSTRLPGGLYLHVFPDFDTLFPQQFLSCQFTLNDGPLKGEVEEIILRVFSDAGTRDYTLTLSGDAGDK